MSFVVRSYGDSHVLEPFRDLRRDERRMKSGKKCIFVFVLVDTHTHFYDEWLLPDADAAVKRAMDAGVGKMIQADVDSRERKDMWAVGRRYPGVLFQMLGLYPGSVTQENWQQELDLVHSIAEGDSRSEPGMTGVEPGMSADEPGMTGSESWMSEGFPGPIVAIGEVGLDYHENRDNAALQKDVLRIQLELAAKMDLPVNIHLRDAWEDFLAILKDTQHLHLRGNLHCFSGSYEVYQEANRYGDWAVGIGGVITFKNSKLAATVARIPDRHILLETDAPYLAPTPYRGKRNESAFLPIIAAKVAEAKGLTTAQIEDLTTENAQRLFQI